MKKETLEEIAERLYPCKPFWIGSGASARLHDDYKTQRDSFIEGAKWQQERSYSEEEVLDIVYKIYEEFNIYISKETALIKLKKK